MDDIPTIENEIKIPKTRGRKKKEVVINENEVTEVKKKRGRKKKWEVETTSKLLDNTPIIFSKTNTSTTTKEINSNYEQQDISFGTLSIKVHTNKDIVNTDNIISSLRDKKIDKCKINLTSSDFDDFEKEKQNRKSIEIKNIKIMKFYKDTFDSGKDILLSPYRCYNCHNTFKNKPFFLPVDYCPKTNRYKVTGNYCSPNCVKAYAMNHKIYCNKSYLVAQMYKKLFGMDYKISVAPPIQLLKEYGGPMTIDEYRHSFYTDKNYSLKNLNYKIVLDEIITN